MQPPSNQTIQPTHVYEVRPRKDHRGVDLISDVLPFGRLWYGDPDAITNAIGYAKFFSRSHDAVIRVYDEAGNVISRTTTRAISKSRERFGDRFDFGGCGSALSAGLLARYYY
jgi:hypothetical protein